MENTMAETAAASLAQHPPAVKVGGRRLSINSKPHIHHSMHSPSEVNESAIDTSNPSYSAAEPVSSPTFDDYPRPIHHSEESKQNSEEQAEHHKEKIPHFRREQKRVPSGPGVAGMEKFTHNKKGEETMPTREHSGGGHSFGAGGRIVQPAGKGL
ncbi:hypothetical protein FB446DRAFT_740500 [Lentinula raphanica]|nr:hypothetical protein FB446DRAFT_740500 [Lentinula raphanica]